MLALITVNYVTGGTPTFRKIGSKSISAAITSDPVSPTAQMKIAGQDSSNEAKCALLPPHAPDMLTVRIQVIDGTGTFTQSDLSLVGCSLRFHDFRLIVVAVDPSAGA